MAVQVGAAVGFGFGEAVGVGFQRGDFARIGPVRWQEYGVGARGSPCTPRALRNSWGLSYGLLTERIRSVKMQAALTTPQGR